jgi:hypothetical protein
MLGTAVVTLLCAAGVAFHLRFLVALGNESKPRLVGYRVLRLHDAPENATAELRGREQPATRAA